MVDPPSGAGLLSYLLASLVVAAAFAGLATLVAGHGEAVETAEMENAVTVELPPALASPAPASIAPEGPAQTASPDAPAAPPEVQKAQAPVHPARDEPPPPIEPDAREPPPADTPTPAAAAPSAAREERAPSGSQIPARPDTAGEDDRPRASSRLITAWQRALVGRIEQAKRGHAGLHAAGTTRVEFVIDRSGALASVSVRKTSGVAAIDAAALAMVREAAPFPRPPDGIEAKGLVFVVPVVFRRR